MLTARFDPKTKTWAVLLSPRMFAALMTLVRKENS